jgi:hypothetical protein
MLARIKNFPFLHNKRLDDRDAETRGGLRRCIRIVKSIRADADAPPDFSSYDIVSLCYNIPRLALTLGSDIGLVGQFLRFATSVMENSAVRESLSVPNDTRKLFGGSEGASIEGCRKLVEEVLDVYRAALSARAA